MEPNPGSKNTLYSKMCICGHRRNNMYFLIAGYIFERGNKQKSKRHCIVKG